MRTILIIFALYTATEAVVGLFRPAQVFGDELLLLLDYHESKLRFFIHNTINSLFSSVFIISAVFTPDKVIDQYELYYAFGLFLMAVSWTLCNLINLGQITRPPRRPSK